MAVLSDAARFRIWKMCMERASGNQEPLPVLKQELMAVVNAADDWVEINRGSFNSALPLPGRTALTAKQKLEILAMIMQERYEVA